MSDRGSDSGLELANDADRGFDRFTGVAADIELYEHIATGWPMHCEHRVLLDELCRHADLGKFPLFLTISPHVPAARFDTESARVLRSAQDLLLAMSRAHPYCHVLGGDREYHSPLFSDHSHLNASGALLFTRELSREYLATGTGGRAH